MKKIQIKKNKQEVKPTRITNETVAQHRESILAGGRKFKYPVQYSKHKLIINTIIISLIAIITGVVFIWHQLYVARAENNFLHRVTKVLPLPVAKVDGQSVRYSDYLTQYLSQVHFMQTQESANLQKDRNGEQQLDYYRLESMEVVAAAAYAKKIAKQEGITVSNEEVNSRIEAQYKKADSSEGNFQNTLMSYFNWTLDEYKEIIRDRLYVEKVKYILDEDATNLKSSVEKMISEGKTLQDIKDALGDKVTLVSRENLPKSNDDRGVSSTAASLEVGKISKALTEPGDGYYYIAKQSETSDTVTYSYIHIPVQPMSSYLQKLKDEGRLKYYIELPDSVKPVVEGGVN